MDTEQQTLAPSSRDTSATYMSTRPNLSIRLRPPVRTNVNGRDYRTPGLRANFRDHRLVTTNPEIIETLDEMLCGEFGNKWQRKFYKIPSKDVIKKMGAAQRKAQEVAKRELENNMDSSQREQLDGWHKFLEKQRSARAREVAEKETA